MKSQKRMLVVLCLLMLFTLSCNLATLTGSQATEAPISSQDEGQTPPVKGAKPTLTLPAEGEIQYFPAFPLKVTDATGTLKILNGRVLAGMNRKDMVVVVENISPDPLKIYESLDWQNTVFTADGAVAGTNSGSEPVSFPPGQTIVLHINPGKWTGDADHFELKFVGGKLRNIQPDMVDKFRAFKMPSPMLTVVADPATIPNGDLFGRKVIRTQANAVITNPNPGKAKSISPIAVYYDTDGQIVGYAMGKIVDIPSGGQASVIYEGMSYFAGDPVAGEYYAYLSDPYYIEELFKLW